MFSYELFLHTQYQRFPELGDTWIVLAAMSTLAWWSHQDSVVLDLLLVVSDVLCGINTGVAVRAEKCNYQVWALLLPRHAVGKATQL